MFARRLPPSGHALVTGGASGLGRAIAEILTARGWTVARVDLAGPNWPPAGSALDAVLDVRDAAGWKALHERLRAEWPGLDLVVNAAGVGAAAEVGSLPEDQWRRVLDTNLLGTALGCETFVPWLREHPRRSYLVNIASIAGLIAPPSLAAYGASKAGVVALSDSIAAEVPRGRPWVTVACPGFFRSGLLGSWHFTGEVAMREAQRRMNGTWWTSERVARRVLAAAGRNHRYLVVGAQARWLWRLKRLAPRATTAAIRAIYRRLR